MSKKRYSKNGRQDKTDVPVNPSILDWKELHKAALEFKETEPWNWMWDSDIFGVQDPVSGQIGYCCIMGKLGKFIGIAVYLGTEGLAGYLKMLAHDGDMEDLEVMHHQRCLSVSFGEKQYLEPDDLKVLKRLGMKLGKRDSWPLFRNYQPGYQPWYLIKEDARFLTICLEQAKKMALRFKEDAGLFASCREDSYLVTVPQKTAGGIEWKDSCLEPVPVKRITKMIQTIDLKRLEAIRTKISQSELIWEMDFFYAPACVTEKRKKTVLPNCIYMRG